MTGQGANAREVEGSDDTVDAEVDKVRGTADTADVRGENDGTVKVTGSADTADVRGSADTGYVSGSVDKDEVIGQDTDVRGSADTNV